MRVSSSRRKCGAILNRSKKDYSILIEAQQNVDIVREEKYFAMLLNAWAALTGKVKIFEGISGLVPVCVVTRNQLTIKNATENKRREANVFKFTVPKIQ